jgi:amino acid transporter
MWHAVFIILGNVIGSGIFVSPKGVTENMNSVGGSLIIWTVTGFINLGQALCYAELGGMIPEAGGDYAYVFYILGPLPAFLSLWLHILVISASACAVISRTAALYILEPMGLDCRNDIITIIALVIIGKHS